MTTYSYPVYNTLKVLAHILENFAHPKDVLFASFTFHYLVDLHKEEALVLHGEYQSEYNDLVASNYDNDHIMIFSTDDEILELLENGSSGTINGRIAGCDDRRATSRKADAVPKMVVERN